MDRVAGKGAAGTVPRPQDGESEPETRADLARWDKSASSGGMSPSPE
jgi:hypothetical protein